MWNCACGELNEEKHAFCGRCGAAQHADAQVSAAQAPSPHYEEYYPPPGGYFDFRAMVSPFIIKLIYVFGMLILTCGGGLIFYSAFHPEVLPSALVSLFNTQRLGNSPSIRFMVGLGMLLPGNLIWRVLCEAAILFYSMHERLVSIEDRLRVRG